MNSQRVSKIPKRIPKRCKKSLKIPKIFPKKILKKIPRISNINLKNSQNFENIQFPTSHLEAENPFGLV